MGLICMIREWKGPTLPWYFCVNSRPSFFINLDITSMGSKFISTHNIKISWYTNSKNIITKGEYCIVTVVASVMLYPSMNIMIKAESLSLTVHLYTHFSSIAIYEFSDLKQRNIQVQTMNTTHESSLFSSYYTIFLQPIIINVIN